MAERLVMDSNPHDLILGNSFNPTAKTAFHSIRYDFKPASVDTSKVSTVDMGANNEVTIDVPHVEGAGTASTVYKGPKRPCQKECILIINHETGEIMLEKLMTTVQLKKTRKEGSSKARQHANRPVTPVDKSSQKKQKQSPDKRSYKDSPMSWDGESRQSPLVSPGPSPVHEDVGIMSSSDADSDSSDDEPPAPTPTQKRDVVKQSHNSAFRPPEKQGFMSTLKDDLQLSDSSGSGSDSD